MRHVPAKGGDGLARLSSPTISRELAAFLSGGVQRGGHAEGPNNSTQSGRPFQSSLDPWGLALTLNSFRVRNFLLLESCVDRERPASMGGPFLPRCLDAGQSILMEKIIAATTTTRAET
jgi:hypothetical protein